MSLNTRLTRGARARLGQGAFEAFEVHFKQFEAPFEEQRGGRMLEMWRNVRAGEDTCEAAASKSSSSSVIVTAARVGTCAMFERDRVMER